MRQVLNIVIAGLILMGISAGAYFIYKNREEKKEFKKSLQYSIDSYKRDSASRAMRDRYDYADHEIEMMSLLRQLGKSKKQIKDELDGDFLKMYANHIPEWWLEYQQWRDSALLKLKQ